MKHLCVSICWLVIRCDLRRTQSGAKCDCHGCEIILTHLHIITTDRLWLPRLKWPHLVYVPFGAILGSLKDLSCPTRLSLCFPVLLHLVLNCVIFEKGHEGSLVGHSSGCCRATGSRRIGWSHSGPQGFTEPQSYRMAGGSLCAATGRQIAIRTAPRIHAQGVARCLGICEIPTLPCSLFR